jgi:amino acid transporter
VTDRPHHRTWRPAAFRRAHHHGGKHAGLSVIDGISALSLDALSSVAYGPESMVLVLVTAGAGAVRFALPLTIVITGMLVLLIISYSQVIAAHPDGGGSYAVGKQDIGKTAALLAAGSLFVDYVLTVAVSLAAGAASLGSAFPFFSHHLLDTCLIGLVLLTSINMVGLQESAKVLMLPTLVFIVSTLAIIVAGPVHWHTRLVGTVQHIPVTASVGVILILKAFAAGCSAVTGVEAIANGVPAFREPKVRTAQRTEFAIGVLLAVMLVGLSVLINVHHVMPRHNVTILAQLTAGAMGTGWPYYVSNIAVALILAFAANTSFGGLPVLMQLLARDHRMPHLFYLRAERPVFRHGIVALSLFSGLLLIAVGGITDKLIPMFCIGVFVGFTISQVGLVLHWWRCRASRWQLRIALNGTGAVMTAVAALVFVSTKFTAGAWVVVITVPALMFMFHRIERYYAMVASELHLGKTPARPHKSESIVIVPTSTVNVLTERVMSAAISIGETVVAVAVAGDEDDKERVMHDWAEWKSGIPLEVIVDPQRSLVRSVLNYLSEIDTEQVTVTVLIPEIEPRKRIHAILHNQRGALLATVLMARTDVVVARYPFRLHD